MPIDLSKVRGEAVGGYSDVCKAGLRVFWFDLNSEEAVTWQKRVYWYVNVSCDSDSCTSYRTLPFIVLLLKYLGLTSRATKTPRNIVALNFSELMSDLRLKA